MNPHPEVEIGSDARDAAERAGAELIAMVQSAAGDNRRVAIALSGGSTPKLLYDSLIERSQHEAIPWQNVDWFFGDERCVPPDSSESNYRLAHERLLEPLAISADRVHRIEAELEPPALAAANYERDLREYFRSRAEARFDLILLGVGAEGHTASLFPGSDALEETGRWVLSVKAPATYPTTDRITLTLPTINRARAVFFLAVGVGKQQIVHEVLTTTEPIPNLPAARVRPGPGARLVWFLDKAAGG